MNERILIDRQICHGKPVVRGTRTPVSVIRDALAAGDSFEMIKTTTTSPLRTFGPALHLQAHREW